MKRPTMRPEMRAPMRPLTDKAGEVRELTKEDMRLFKPIAEVDPGMGEAMKGVPSQSRTPESHRARGPCRISSGARCCGEHQGERTRL